ncbi:MAG: tRNA (adenosine(37)-N6)-threonylcarbamoyltransferase complex ATPase subunit type 1 TsaE [Eubacteriales bacterium]|nr:tRNA (adenosine(37)-N6)-threonylcarbamoyltransferase complex ATPase subunit type 1 TsaE [Eubacteriales bacterium]MDY3332349.1 tRNA (adenosine(37)-N6)-threonylcarbamoyltransferase complex ATPase subunit type 1 TsaE [Gallibacter sp.]
MNTLIIKNENDTKLFAEALTPQLKPGDIIALVGDLGTGKTTLTQYIARCLGITEDITSPTFNIVKEYKSGKIPLYHFDVYRIKSLEDLFEIGYEEYFYGNGISIIEWADLIYEAIPENAYIIDISKDKADPNKRIYNFNFDINL